MGESTVIVGTPVCHADSDLDPASLERIQLWAESDFYVYNPIQEDEFLRSPEVEKRLEAITLATDLPKDFNLVAHAVTGRLHLRSDQQEKTATTVADLFKSERVETNEIITLLTTMDSGNRRDFYAAVHVLFHDHHSLFFFADASADKESEFKEEGPVIGVICYIEQGREISICPSDS